MPSVLTAGASQLWTVRTAACLDFVRSVGADIVLLQELWLDCEEFLDMLKQAMEEEYDCLLLKRTRWKDDGLGILVRKDAASVVDVSETAYGLSGNRVCLAALLEVAARSEGQAGVPTRLVVANTHLTFPHHAYDIDMRLRQVQRAQEALEAFCPPEAPLIFGGDFNGYADNVYEFMEAQGYVSAYRAVHGRDPGITHRNHRAEDVCVRPCGGEGGGGRTDVCAVSVAELCRAGRLCKDFFFYWCSRKFSCLTTPPPQTDYVWMWKPDEAETRLEATEAVLLPAEDSDDVRSDPILLCGKGA